MNVNMVRRSKIISVLLLALLLVSLHVTVLEAMPPVQRTVLPNGLVLLTSEEHSLPFITFNLLLNAGSRQDPAGEEGVANLTVRGLRLGTRKHTATELNEELDFMGASLETSADRDYVTLSLKVLTKDLEKGVGLLTEVLCDPTFPTDEMQREIRQVIAALQAVEERPEELADRNFQETLFGNSPYGHPVEGKKDSVGKISREAMVRFYQTYYHPNNAILAVAGDMSAEDLAKTIIPLLSQWSAGTLPEEHFVSFFNQGPKKVTVDRDLTQANVIIGHEGVSRGNPDFYALAVMNFIMGGGGFVTRLMEEIREKRGLAYYVQSFFEPGKYPASFKIVLQTKNSSTREAIALSLQQMERMQKEEVSDQELERAKKYLTGSFPLRLDTQGKLAAFLTQVEYYGLGLDYLERYPSLIRAVTSAEVTRVARTYLHPERCIMVIVANLKQAGMWEGEGK